MIAIHYCRDSEHKNVCIDCCPGSSLCIFLLPAIPTTPTLPSSLPLSPSPFLVFLLMPLIFCGQLFVLSLRQPYQPLPYAVYISIHQSIFSLCQPCQFQCTFLASLAFPVVLIFSAFLSSHMSHVAKLRWYFSPANLIDSPMPTVFTVPYQPQLWSFCQLF